MRRCILLIIVLSFCAFNGQGQLPEKALSAGDCDTTLPYEEGWDDASTWDCWTNYPAEGTAEPWKISPNGGRSGDCLQHPLHANHHDDWFVSPKITIPEGGIYELSFCSWNNWLSYYQIGENSVWISKTGANPIGNQDFVQIWTPVIEDIQEYWVETKISLEEYAGEEIYIAFRYNATNTHDWWLDDVKVAEVTTVDCNISEFPYVEGANASASLPECWTNYADATTTKPWGVYSDNWGLPGYVTGEKSIVHTNGGADEPLDDWLVSPKISIPDDGKTYRLSFWTYDYYPEKYPYPDNDNPHSGNSVWISKTGEDPTANDNGFVKIWWPTSSVSASWSLVTCDLSEYAGQEIYIAFRYNATNGHEWYLDDIKVAELTDCTVSSLPYNQTWESNDFLECWKIHDIDGDDANACWKIGTDNTHSGSRSIYHNDHNSHNQDGWLVSPKITVPATGHYRLSFWEYNNFYLVYNPASGNKNTVLISEDSSDPESDDFEPVYSPGEVEGEWVQTKINLDNYLGKDIYIAFRYQGENAHQWWLDDLKIEQIPNYDAGVTAILSPRSGELGTTETVRIKVKNYGATALENVPVKLEIDDVVTLTGSVPAIDYDKEVEYEFTQTVDLSAAKTYSLKAYTELTGDADAANDSVTATVISVTCDDPTFPYEVGAEDALQLLCWTNYSLDAITDNVWKASSAFAHSETNSIGHNWGDVGVSQDDWFVSPKITIPADGIYRFSFWSYNDESYYYPFGGNSVWISKGSPNPAGDNSNFEQIWSPLPESVSDSWVETKLRLDEYAGEEIYIAFRYKAEYRHGWYVDDIKIGEIVGPDAAVTAITSPVSGANRLSGETITIKVKNLGSTPLSNIPVKAEITDQINNETTVINDTIRNLLTVNAETEYSFPDKADLSVVGTYNIRVYTLVENDIDTSNDEATVTVTNNGNVAAIGIDTEVTTCDIRFTDDAIDSDYHGLDEDGKTTQTITFHPAVTENRLKVEFTSFVTKPYETHRVGDEVFELHGDTLFIYSGNTRDESQLLLALVGDLTGKLPPVIRSRAADGSLTFVFDKHKNTEGPGWEANVSCFTPQPQDVGVQQVLAPLSGGNEAAQVKVLIENYGSEPASGFSVAYSLNNAPAVTETFTNTIAARETAEFTFTQTVDLTEHQTHRIEAYTIWTSDGDTSNDTASVSFSYNENIELYGYRIWDDDWYDLTKDEDDMLAHVSFNSNSPETVTKLHPYRDGSYNIICAAEYFDGFIYAYTTGNDEFISANFVKLKSDDWSVVSKTSASDWLITDMTYDYSTSTMYAVTLDSDTEISTLRTVDLATGALTKVIDLPQSARLSTLASDLNGRLYGIELSGELVEVNKTTGVLRIVGDTGFQPFYFQSMAFDHNTGRLFWAMTTATLWLGVPIDAIGRLVELNPETGAATNLGNIGNNAQIVGLHTIYNPDDVGLAEVTDQDLITVYPNPTTGVVYVSAIPDNSSLSIIDLSGKVLETHASVSGTVRLDLHLNSGVYIIRIENGNRNVMKKLLVN